MEDAETLCIDVYDSDTKFKLKKLGSDDYMGSIVVELTEENMIPGKRYTLPLTNTIGNKKLEKELATANDVKDPLGYLTFMVSIEGREAQSAPRSMKALNGKQVRGKKKGGYQTTKWLTIDVLEAKDLCPITRKGTHNPLVEVCLGSRSKSKKNVQKSRSKINTLAPQWRQRFEFELAPNQFSLTMTVYNHAVETKNEMGKAFLPLRSVKEGDKANLFWLPLNSDEDLGFILVAVTIIDYVDNSFASPGLELPLHDSTAATLIVKVVKGTNLKAADFGGKSDPFCVVQVGEKRQRTATFRKTLNPAWNHTMMFEIGGIDKKLKLADVKSDIFGFLDCTIYDQDNGGKAEFLGCVRIPITSITPGKPQQIYGLKDADMLVRAKGELELHLTLNIDHPTMARLALFGRQPRVVLNRGGKFKLKKLFFTVGRVTKMVGGIVNFILGIEKVIKWQYGILPSVLALTAWQYLCYYGSLWMVPMPIIGVLVWNYFKEWPRSNLLNDLPGDQLPRPVYDDDEGSEDEDEDEDAAGDEEKKKEGLRSKYRKVIQHLQVVQDKLGKVVGTLQRVKNLVRAEVPLITLVFAVILMLISIITYMVQTYILMSAIGAFLFGSQFVKFYVVPFVTGRKRKKKKTPNKLLEILSRIPSQNQLAQYRRLPPQTMSMQAAKRGSFVAGEEEDNS